MMIGEMTILVLGAYRLRKKLPREHRVVLIDPKPITCSRRVLWLMTGLHTREDIGTA